MKTLCITGLHATDIEFVDAVLRQSGVAKPQPSNRDESVDIVHWHEQATKRLQEMNRAGPKGNEPVVLGRVWEQLASDIFMANFSSDVWGWADTRSFDFLTFWLDFDPQMRFVLVACSPERHLSHIVDDTSEALKPEEQLSQWASHHLKALQFYHRHSDRVVLVDIEDCINNPAGLIQACQKAWDIKLQKVHFPQATATEFSPMVKYLAKLLCEPHQAHRQIHAELSASLTPIGSGWRIQSTPDLDMAINAYRDARREFVEQAGVLSELSVRATTQILDAKESFEATAQISGPGSEHAELTTQLHQRQGHSGDQIAIDQGNQLDELKRTIDTLTSEKASLEARLKDAEEEGELILLQLHQVQEELENYFLKFKDSDNRLEQMQARYQRLVERVPQYFDLQAIEVVSFDRHADQKTSWRLKGLDAAGRFFETLTFSTHIEAGQIVFELPREVDEKPIFARWPAEPAETSVTIALVGDEESGQKRAEVLQLLAKSDLELVRALAHVLHESLTSPGLLQAPADFSSAVVIDAIERFEEKLAELPSMFRFDSIGIKREQTNPDYEHLWLTFRHVSLGDRRLLDFDFRLSCANIRPGSFGQQPKLEFPEASGRAALQGWFDESYDDYGSKLELRFSLPSSMDREVWRQLPEPDQAFIGALVSQLPLMLQELQQSGQHLQRPWADWLQLAQDLRRIFLLSTAPLDLDFDDDLTVDESLKQSSTKAKGCRTKSGSTKAGKTKPPVKRVVPNSSTVVVTSRSKAPADRTRKSA